MQETSELYKQILLSDKYRVETTLVIGESGRLLTERAEVLRFGGDAILVSTGGANDGYGEDMLISVKTTRRLFSGNVPMVGCCTCGEIYVEMHMPIGEIPKMAQLSPYVRLVSTENPNVFSEWIHKGVFFIDTRDNSHNDDSLDILTLHGYDAMIRANQLYGSSTLQFPARDIDIVYDIASKMGVNVDTRCVPYINKGYEVQYPVEYTCREILGYIGAMYAGNWIINDNGDLQLIVLYDLPEETSLLIDEHTFYITFGGDRIKL